MRVILVLTLPLIMVQSLAPAQTTAPRRLVGNLKNSSLADGCGCYFKSRGTPENAERYIFFSSIENDNNKTAWMNIAGLDVKLKLEKKIGPFGTERERVGSRSTVRYTSGDIAVNGTYVVTRECPPRDENCESTDYSVTFVVKKGARSEVVKAKGACGC